MQDISQIPLTSLSQSARAEIDQWLKKYPSEQKQSALLPALHIVQKEHGGWLPKAAIDLVADYLGISHIAAYEVATFYSMYDLAPVGKHKIRICTSISCMLCGSDRLKSALETKLGIKTGETTADGIFTLKEVECLAACAGAPVVMIDEQYHERVQIEDLDQLLTTAKESFK